MMETEHGRKLFYSSLGRKSITDFDKGVVGIKEIDQK